ncbi:MAG TPA: hypothetical protein VGG61_08355, partial [Gemmataceae bacterium]
AADAEGKGESWFRSGGEGWGNANRLLPSGVAVGKMRNRVTPFGDCSTLLAVSQTSSPNILLESREPHTLLALAEAGQGERSFRRSLRTDG